MSNEEDTERYERILEMIGYGRFQMLYNIFFACLANMITSCTYYSLYWVLVIPDHWCKVPMPMNANYTMEEWRNITIPRSNQSSLQEFETCKMYDYDLGNNIFHENTSGCVYGWDYDTTWYKRTIPSQENWICEREYLVTNALSAASIGEGIGILFFGYVGDRLGRRKSLLLTNTILLIGRALSFFTPNIYWLFYLGILIGNFASQMSMSTFMLIGMEFNDARHRPLLNAFYSLGDCLAYLFMAGFFWVFGDWVVFLATLLSLLIVNIIIVYLFQIESPKWLLSKNKHQECLTVLKKICRINGVRVDDNNFVNVLESLDSEKERVVSRESIFKQKSFLKNFVLIFLEWCCCMMVQGVFLLNIWYVGGNPFLVYVFQATASIPGNLVGNYLCNRLGRRLNLLIMFSFLMAILLMMIFLTTSHAEALPILSVASGFFIYASWESIYVQTIEILPASFGSRGYSVCQLGGNLSYMSVPYILLLGNNVNIRLPYIISGGVMALGIFACALSPETLHKKGGI